MRAILEVQYIRYSLGGGSKGRKRLYKIEKERKRKEQARIYRLREFK